MPSKMTISVDGGKITLEDEYQHAWQKYLEIFDMLAKKAKAKTATLRFEAPDIKRSLLDAVPAAELEKKIKSTIFEGSATVPVKTAHDAIEMAKGFDIAVRIEPVELIFFHTGKLEILTELQLVPAIIDLLKKMFRSAKVEMA